MPNTYTLEEAPLLSLSLLSVARLSFGFFCTFHFISLLIHSLRPAQREQTTHSAYAFQIKFKFDFFTQLEIKFI